MNDYSQLQGGGDPNAAFDHHAADPTALAAAVAETVAATGPPPPPPESGQFGERRGATGPKWAHRRTTTTRPDWHGHRTPPAVAEAWRDVETAVASWWDLSDQWADTVETDRQADRATAAAAVEALEAGRPFPIAPAGTSGAELRRTIEATANAVAELAARRRRTYDNVVSEELPAWREAIAADHNALWDAAVTAWDAFDAAYAAATASATVLEAQNTEIDPGWLNANRSGLRPEPSHLPRLRPSIKAVNERIHSADTLLNGKYLAEPLGMPTWPAWLRTYVANSDLSTHRKRLAEIERGEGWRITTHTARPPA